MTIATASARRMPARSMSHQPAEEVGVVGGAGDDVREVAEHVEPVRGVAEGEPVEFAVLDGALFDQRAVIARAKAVAGPMDRPG